jgi:hypothetical protein
MYFEVYRDVHGYWRWRLKAANHRIVASGESYRSRGDCLGAIGLVQSSSSARVYQI